MLKVFALHKHSHSFWKDEAAATTAAATGATGAAKGGATPAPAPAPTLAQEDEDCARHTNHSHADTLSLTASAVANAASEEEDAEDGCVQLTYELFFHTSVDIGHWHTLECTPAMSCVRVVCVCVCVFRLPCSVSGTLFLAFILTLTPTLVLVTTLTTRANHITDILGTCFLSRSRSGDRVVETKGIVSPPWSCSTPLTQKMP